mmetsp:Transcript_11467/g.17381  ORF Transcript_11467/g.17381 Transcript_11467/m.17381 type:complete len:248 (-) Transcript_11467:128-871(-)
MAAPMVSALIANILWVDNELTLDEIKTLLRGWNHQYAPADDELPVCASNGCHLVHWSCEAYSYELLDYAIDIDMDDTTDVPTTVMPTRQPITISPSTNTPTDAPPVVAAPDTDIKCALSEDIRPCHCFDDAATCSAQIGCSWMEEGTDSECITSAPLIYVPTSTVSGDHSNSGADEWTRCCNGRQNVDHTLCKPIETEAECVANNACIWDVGNCMDEMCLSTSSSCSSNQECCSGICVRFKSMTFCV